MTKDKKKHLKNVMTETIRLMKNPRFKSAFIAAMEMNRKEVKVMADAYKTMGESFETYKQKVKIEEALDYASK